MFTQGTRRVESSDADLPRATSFTKRDDTYVSVDWLTLVQEAARTDRDQVLWNGQSVCVLLSQFALRLKQNGRRGFSFVARNATI